MDPRLRLERFPPPAGLETGAAKSAGQRLAYWPTGTPDSYILSMLMYILHFSEVREMIEVPQKHLKVAKPVCIWRFTNTCFVF